MTSVDQLLDALIEAAPALQIVTDEHVREYGELLTHVLFGDVTRWLAANPQPAALAVLEQSFVTGDEDTRNLIAVSFVENIGPGPEYAALREALGPKLRALWSAMYN